MEDDKDNDSLSICSLSNTVNLTLFFLVTEEMEDWLEDEDDALPVLAVGTHPHPHPGET